MKSIGKQPLNTIVNFLINYKMGIVIVNLVIKAIEPLEKYFLFLINIKNRSNTMNIYPCN